MHVCMSVCVCILLCCVSYKGPPSSKQRAPAVDITAFWPGLTNSSYRNPISMKSQGYALILVPLLFSNWMGSQLRAPSHSFPKSPHMPIRPQHKLLKGSILWAPHVCKELMGEENFLFNVMPRSRSLTCKRDVHLEALGNLAANHFDQVPVHIALMATPSTNCCQCSIACRWLHSQLHKVFLCRCHDLKSNICFQRWLFWFPLVPIKWCN